MTEDPTDTMLTVRDLAKLLQVQDQTIYRMVRRGDLVCYSIGRTKRFRRQDVDAFLKRCRTNGSNQEGPVA